MQESKGAVAPVLSSSSSSEVDLVILDDEALAQVVGSASGPGGSWSDMTAGPGGSW